MIPSGKPGKFSTSVVVVSWPPAATPPAKKTAKTASAKVHVVKAGETLYQISRQYGLTVDQLKKINKMGSDVTIRPGQELKVSAP